MLSLAFCTETDLRAGEWVTPWRTPSGGRRESRREKIEVILEGIVDHDELLRLAERILRAARLPVKVSARWCLRPCAGVTFHRDGTLKAGIVPT